MWSVSQLLVIFFALALGVAAGWWASSTRGAQRREERHVRRVQRHAWLEAAFEALQRLHWSLEMELDPSRAALLDDDEREARLDAVVEALRATELDLRARRYLLEAELGARLSGALEACWTTLAALKAGQRPGPEAAATEQTLRETLAEFEDLLRAELGTVSRPREPIHAPPEALEGTLEPDEVYPGHAQQPPPARPGRQVDLSALDEPEAREEPAAPSRPPTYINLD